MILFESISAQSFPPVASINLYFSPLSSPVLSSFSFFISVQSDFTNANETPEKVIIWTRRVMGTRAGSEETIRLQTLSLGSALCSVITSIKQMGGLLITWKRTEHFAPAEPSSWSASSFFDLLETFYTLTSQHVVSDVVLWCFCPQSGLQYILITATDYKNLINPPKKSQDLMHWACVNLLYLYIFKCLKALNC